MKHLRKIMALVLSLAMVLAMSITAFATEGSGTTQTYSITITNATGTYNAYQVFAGNLVEEEGKKILTNISWGSGVNQFSYQIGVDENNSAKMSNSATEIAEYLSGKDDSEARKFAAIAANNVKETATGSATANSGNAFIDKLPAGYYVIKNTVNGTSGESESRYILQVVGNTKVANKANVPSFEKKLKDINDSTDSNYTDWQDSADYDIGDEIPFKLEGTVASNYADYKGAYYFAFHDVEESGLTFNKKSVKVFIGNTKIDSGYTVVTDNLKDGCTFEVVFSDLKTISGVNAGTKIVVEYTSTLNENAVLGNQGNVNKAKLEFSNNPNEEQEGSNKPSTGETPWDNVIVFTYMVEVNKVDQDNKALSGANFKLEKKVPGENNEENWKLAKEITDLSTTKFEFKGLDDGDYKLTETKTPDGYNTIDPITFTVTATHDIEWTTKSRTEVLGTFKGDKVSGDIKLTASKEQGKLSTDVVNKSGSLLPETGGIGTTIFYIVGVVLVLGAGVLFVTKKRMNADK